MTTAPMVFPNSKSLRGLSLWALWQVTHAGESQPDGRRISEESAPAAGENRRQGFCPAEPRSHHAETGDHESLALPACRQHTPFSRPSNQSRVLGPA